MSAIIKLKEARATLLYVESILYWQANKTKPSPIIIREKVIFGCFQILRLFLGINLQILAHYL